MSASAFVKLEKKKMTSKCNFVFLLQICFLGDNFKTKPIDPVQVALSLFEEKGDQNKPGSSSASEEMDREKDVEGLIKELSNYKLQMEAKDSAYLQLEVKFEYFQSTIQELSTMIKNSEVERDFYKEECRVGKLRINELESMAEEVADQSIDTWKLKEQLSVVLGELKACQEELIRKETELAAVKDEKLKALTEIELMEVALKHETERSEELLRNASMLNEALLMSKLDAIQAETENGMVLSQKDSEIESATEKVEEMRKHMENELLAKSVLIDLLQEELNLKGTEMGNSGQELLVGASESKLNQLRLDLKNSNDDVNRLQNYVDVLENELHMVKSDLNESKEREDEALVKIAILKSALRRGRSELCQENVSKPEAEERKDENDNATISLEEYKFLIAKAGMANQSVLTNPDKQFPAGNKNELETLKKELEAAIAKVADFRNRTEQAVSRAEAAERAKFCLEEQLKRWQERRQKRKAALAALQQESFFTNSVASSSSDAAPQNYQTLGKILNLNCDHYG